jgi:hypothetical protein
VAEVDEGRDEVVLDLLWWECQGALVFEELAIGAGEAGGFVCWAGQHHRIVDSHVPTEILAWTAICRHSMVLLLLHRPGREGKPRNGEVRRA